MASPETVLADLPRLTRIGAETRWRGQSAVATAVVVGAFWGLTWAVGEPVEVWRTLAGLVAVALPTHMVARLTGARRVRATLTRTRRPPRSGVHETAAAARERRLRLAGLVLGAIMLLMLADRFTGGGGTMAGLVAGLLAGLGAADWREARLWDAAERERASRLFAVVRPRALSPALAPDEIFELPHSQPDTLITLPEGWDGP